jgi:hypothetical protein
MKATGLQRNYWSHLLFIQARGNQRHLFCGYKYTLQSTPPASSASSTTYYASTRRRIEIGMWPAATMFALGFLLCPFPALSPSARNLTALLPELRDLFGSLYRHCRQEFVLLASTRRRRRGS